jgi:hypothetical protein
MTKRNLLIERRSMGKITWKKMTRRWNRGKSDRGDQSFSPKLEKFVKVVGREYSIENFTIIRLLS